MIIVYVAYATSEVDDDAIRVSKTNHGKTICQSFLSVLISLATATISVDED